MSDDDSTQNDSTGSDDTGQSADGSQDGSQGAPSRTDTGQNDDHSSDTRDSAPTNTDELPKWAQDQLRQARNDAAKYRTRSKELEPLAQKAKELEDASKSEMERLQEQLATYRSTAEKSAAALRRREVAESRAPEHATVAQIRAVAKRVAGSTDDELEADADELFGLLAPKPAEIVKVPTKPQERMARGGGDPDEKPDVTDPRKLAALIPRSR